MDGHELFFESRDLRPACVPELFATALLPVAVGRGRRLIVDRALDPVWLDNVEGVLRVWRSWWGTSADLSAVVVAPPSSEPDRASRARAGRVGLCFSLGVDSFHSLLRSGRAIDLLVLAEGYDIPLGDIERMAAVRSSLREITRRTGVEHAIVRTNLRDHPSSLGTDWERAHGGALAALGHACSDEIGELLISSTKPRFADAPWGSHWDTDRGWSTTRLLVTHLGEERRRNDKLAAMVDEPLVRRHLRVCWENRSPSRNCGECEKCVRTMLILSTLGRLEDFPVLPDSGSLAAGIDAIRSIPSYLFYVYRAALDRNDDPELERAVERLIERSGG